jgi:hypothetical protein
MAYPSEHLKSTPRRLQMRMEIGGSAQLINFDSLKVFFHNASGRALTMIDQAVDSTVEKQPQTFVCSMSLK